MAELFAWVAYWILSVIVLILIEGFTYGFGVDDSPPLPWHLWMAFATFIPAFGVAGNYCGSLLEDFDLNDLLPSFIRVVIFGFIVFVLAPPFYVTFAYIPYKIWKLAGVIWDGIIRLGVLVAGIF